MKPLIVGIAGGTASGKSKLAKRLALEFPTGSFLVCMDWYYKPFTELSPEDRRKINYDSPDAFDLELFSEQLEALHDGHAVDLPQYDYAKDTRASETVHVENQKIIFVDGILLYLNAELRARYDLKIFVDADEETRFKRRLKRDMEKRGRSFESVHQQFFETVKPMHDLYVEPSKVHADFVVEGGAYNEPAYEKVCAMISEKLKAETGR